MPFCFYNEGLLVISASSPRWLCSWLVHEWKAAQAHMLRFVWTWWGSRAVWRGKMRLGLLFISELENWTERPLAEISHYVFSYSSAMNVPKAGFFLTFVVTFQCCRRISLRTNSCLKTSRFLWFEQKAAWSFAVESNLSYSANLVNISQISVVIEWLEGFGKSAYLLP